MSERIVYECPKCTDRKMLDYRGERNTAPTLWCGCEGFTAMDVAHRSGDAQ